MAARSSLMPEDLDEVQFLKLDNANLLMQSELLRKRNNELERKLRDTSAAEATHHTLQVCECVSSSIPLPKMPKPNQPDPSNVILNFGNIITIPLIVVLLIDASSQQTSRYTGGNPGSHFWSGEACVTLTK